MTLSQSAPPMRLHGLDTLRALPLLSRCSSSSSPDRVIEIVAGCGLLQALQCSGWGHLKKGKFMYAKTRWREFWGFGEV